MIKLDQGSSLLSMDFPSLPNLQCHPPPTVIPPEITTVLLSQASENLFLTFPSISFIFTMSLFVMIPILKTLSNSWISCVKQLVYSVRHVCFSTKSDMKPII